MIDEPEIGSMFHQEGSHDLRAIAALLQRSGRLPADGRVIWVRPVPLSGSGLVGKVSRWELTYATADATGPASLIVKESSSFPESAQFAEVEARFYQDLLPTYAGVGAPEPIATGRDQTSGRTVLLLEDLGDAGFVRQFDGCSGEQAKAALRHLAAFHAQWWGRALPSDTTWLRTPGNSLVGDFCRRWLRAYTGEWPASLGDVPSKLVAGFDRIAERLATAPLTVVHGDFHSQNVRFGGPGDDHPVRFLDFQFLQQACGAVDVARFLATSLRTEVRQELDSALVKQYYEHLLEHGVEDYDFDRCVADIRAAMLWNLATPLALHVLLIMTRNGSWPARFPILERCIAAIDAWGSWDVE